MKSKTMMDRMNEESPDKMLSELETKHRLAARSSSPDIIKSSLPPKENHELAEELLSRFPDVDRAKLLKDIVGLCFFWMRHGNQRQERSACDFLNEVQRLADKPKNQALASTQPKESK